MHSHAATISRWLCLLLILPSTAAAGTAFRLETPETQLVGVNIESDWAEDGILFVNLRDIAKQSFRPETKRAPLQWVSRFGSVSFSMVGRGFATTGMNEAGLALCSLNLRASQPPATDDRYPIDSASWVQYALDTCGTVEDVIAIDKTVRLQDSEGFPSHFFVADAAGGCAVLEYLHGRLVVYRGESLPIPALTNMRYAKALEAHKRGGARWWWANADRSAERFNAAAKRMEAFDPQAKVEAMDYVFASLTSDVSLPTTIWSIAYDLSAKSIRFRAAHSPQPLKIPFDQLDFSCDSPALMMPLNTPSTGDGNSLLVAYDSQRNLALFRGFIANHRLNVSEDESAKLMHFLESFHCAP